MTRTLTPEAIAKDLRNTTHEQKVAILREVFAELRDGPEEEPVVTTAASSGVGAQPNCQNRPRQTKGRDDRATDVAKIRSMAVVDIVRRCWPIDSYRLAYVLRIHSYKAGQMLCQAHRMGQIRKISRGVYAP